MSWERDAFSTLDLWQRTRGTTPEGRRIYDNLWRAACWQATAKEQLADGNVIGALEAMKRADELYEKEMA